MQICAGKDVRVQYVPAYAYDISYNRKSFRIRNSRRAENPAVKENDGKNTAE